MRFGDTRQNVMTGDVYQPNTYPIGVLLVSMTFVNMIM